jgi:hypothetical protein
MTRYFTHYWSSAYCEEHEDDDEGYPLDHTVSAKYVERGVREDDQVYCFSIRRGKLFLIGKLQVDRMVFTNEEATALVGYQVYPGPEHLIASLATPMRFANEIPLNTAKQLRFVSENHPTLAFVDDAKLDRQTLRNVRELTPQSAALLDTFLDAMEPVELNALG